MKILDEIIFQRFKELIAAKTGLHINMQDKEKILKHILRRMKLLQIDTPEDYLQLLKNNTNDTQTEWQQFIVLLATGETHFFRDKGQFAIIRNYILPEVMERRKSSRSLRIWSAGCSTGEEAYSLAIIVSGLIPDYHNWDMHIIGTDINKQAIEKADRGIYSPWSFRTVDPGIQNRYFSRINNEWELDEKIRWMVKFRTGNLIEDVYPDYETDIHDMDIILCRNVFIYFDSDKVSSVLDKMKNTLSGEGYLITGHTELQSQNLNGLRTRVFPESVAYQKSSPVIFQVEEEYEEVEKNKNSKCIREKNSKSKVPNLNLSMEEAKGFFYNGAHDLAIEILERVVRDNPRYFDAYYLMARAYADLGKYEMANINCRKSIEIDPCAANPYYLMAHIAEAQGDEEEAKNLLKKAIYLAPTFIAAYLELGALYERGHDANRARKMRTTAMELLNTLPPEKAIEPYKETTAGELLKYIKKMLDFTEEK